MYGWGSYRQPRRRLCSLITSVTSSRIIHSWGAASHVLARSKKIHQPANVPQLGLVNGNQSESSRRRRREGGGFCLPTQLSPQSGSTQLFPSSSIDPFQHGVADASHAACCGPAFAAFKEKHTYEKSSSRGSAKEAISITPMSASRAEKVTIL